MLFQLYLASNIALSGSHEANSSQRGKGYRSNELNEGKDANEGARTGGDATIGTICGSDDGKDEV